MAAFPNRRAALMAGGAALGLWKAGNAFAPSLAGTPTRPFVEAHGLRGAAGSASEGPASSGAAAALACGAASVALAASAVRRSRQATPSARGAFESELGVQAPVGYWDPLSMAADGDVEDFARRREAELKNGRVAMFACMGYIVPEYYKLPGYLAPSSDLKFVDVPNGLSAVSKVPAEGWLQWVALCGFYEICVNGESQSGEPGNYGRGRLGVTGASIQDTEGRKRALNAELANGRLAMVAIIGMFFQDGLTGSAWGDWALYQGSGLHGFEKETGVTFPLKYWDPLGMSDDGDVLEFRRRREAEIKNGRVAMIACIGWIVPEYFRWPGYLSPSQDLKFTDIPNGFAALKAMPADGWAQIGVFVAFLELFPLRQEKDRQPGDFPTCGRLGVPWFFVRGAASDTDSDVYNSDPVANRRGLDAEINNGRLAMFAITGMAFQNGVTGTTGPQMWMP